MVGGDDGAVEGVAGADVFVAVATSKSPVNWTLSPAATKFMNKLLSMILANKNDHSTHNNSNRNTSDTKKAEWNTNQKSFNMNSSSISNHCVNFRNRSWDPTVT